MKLRHKLLIPDINWQLIKAVKKLSRIQIVVVAILVLGIVGFSGYGVIKFNQSKPVASSRQGSNVSSNTAHNPQVKSSTYGSQTGNAATVPSRQNTTIHSSGTTGVVPAPPYQWLNCVSAYSFGNNGHVCGSATFDISTAGPCNGAITTSCTMQLNSDQQIMAFVLASSTVGSETTYSQYKFSCSSGTGCDIPAHSIIQKLDSQTYQTNESTTFCCSLLHATANSSVTLEAPSTISYSVFTHGATVGDPTYVMKFKSWAVSYHTPSTPPANTNYYDTFSAYIADQDTSSLYVAPIYEIECHYLNTGNSPSCSP